jgi:hypothetical protein
VLFDLVTRTQLKAELDHFKTEVERDLFRIERDFHKALTVHSLAIITVVTAVIAASHFWR